MAGVIGTLPRYQFSDTAGVPLANGTMETFLAGTTTPVETYSDRALSTSNGVVTQLDAGGWSTFWLDDTVTYKFVLKNEAGATVWTEDNVAGALTTAALGFNAAALSGYYNAHTLASYAALRAYTGAANTTYVSGYHVTAGPTGIAGYFVRDTDDVTSADDGGIVILASNGVRWKRVYDGHVDVRWFGATGDGTTDDTAAIQQAINCMEAMGGGVLYFPGGTYSITGMLTVTAGVFFQGAGFGDVSTASSPDDFYTSIRWDGTDAGTDPMMQVKATTLGDYVWDWGIDGICLNGNNKAYQGLHTASVRMPRIGRLDIERCRHIGWIIDDSNEALGGAFLECDRYVYRSRADAACAASVGLKITGVWTTGCTGMHFTHLVLNTVDGNGLDVGDCDNCVFEKVFGNATGTGAGVRFRGLTNGQIRPSRKNMIGWFSGTTLVAEAESRNVVGWVNSEGTSVQINANGVLDYRVIDRNDGRRWTTPQYLTHEKRHLPLSEGYAAAGTPALTLYGTATIQGIAFAGVGTETWQWVIPPNRQWSEGRITGATVRGIKSTDVNAGDVVFELGALAKGPTSGVGTGFTTRLETHSVDAAAAQTFEEFEMTFATPVAIDIDQHLLIQLSRLPGSAGDTYPDDYAVVSVALHFEADIANSDLSGDYRYEFPVDQIV